MNDRLGEIMLAIGRLEGAIEALKEDILDGKESRGRIHTKLEKIEGDVSIVGQVAAQARDKANLVEKIVATDVKPATDDFRRMRTIGFVGLSLLGFAFTALGITLATVGEGVVNTIRAWLRIH